MGGFGARAKATFAPAPPSIHERLPHPTPTAAPVTARRTLWTSVLRVPQFRVTAANNWWDGSEPTIYNSENEEWNNSKVEFEPVLNVDPRQK